MDWYPNFISLLCHCLNLHLWKQISWKRMTLGCLKGDCSCSIVAIASSFDTVSYCYWVWWMFGSCSYSHACNSDIMSRVPNGKLPRAGHQFPLKMGVFLETKIVDMRVKAFGFNINFEVPTFRSQARTQNSDPCPPRLFFEMEGSAPSFKTPNPPTANSVVTHVQLCRNSKCHTVALSLPWQITKLAIIKSVSNEYTSRIKATKEKVQATPEQRRGIKEIQAHHSIAKAKTTLRCQALLTTSGIRPQASLRRMFKVHDNDGFGGHDWNPDVLKPSLETHASKKKPHRVVKSVWNWKD